MAKSNYTTEGVVGSRREREGVGGKEWGEWYIGTGRSIGSRRERERERGCN